MLAYKMWGGSRVSAAGRTNVIPELAASKSLRESGSGGMLRVQDTDLSTFAYKKG